MKSFHQVLAVAYTEFRFALRRGWPIVGTAAVLFVMGASILVFTFLNMEDLPAKYAPGIGGDALVMIWPAFNLLASAILTMACAPAVALDRQMGVLELLRSLPLTGGRYLLGKVLGTVAAVFLAGAILLVLFLGIHFVFLGPVNGPLYLEVVLISGLPLLVWAPALGIIAAAGAHTRISAVFIGLAAGLTGLLPWGWFAPPPEKATAIMGLSSAWLNRFVSHPPIMEWIWARYGWKDPWWPPVPDSTVGLTLAAAFLILIAAGLLARAWLVRKENF